MPTASLWKPVEGACRARGSGRLLSGSFPFSHVSRREIIRNVFPGEMKTVTSTVDGIIFASYNEGMRHLISACPLAPNSMLNSHVLLK